MNELHAPVIVLDPADNVAVARVNLPAGTSLTAPFLHVGSSVGRGHKIALRPIASGAPVVKYGQIIGVATRDIAAGELVHTENLAISAVNLRHEFCVDAKPTDFVPEARRATFRGYRRPNGKVGTRNYIVIISSVNCSATVSRAVAAHFTRVGELAPFENVDGVVALTHAGGCAMGVGSEGARLLTRTLAGYALNPNVGGVLMIGLGCETNQIPGILAEHGLSEGQGLRTMTIQQSGGTRRTIEAGIAAVRAMLPEVNAVARSLAPASELMIGLECGGSDGYSGISANPALGVASDLLIRHGGTAVLAETPEIYGAEHLLTRRAATPEVAQKLLARIAWWEDYTARNKGEMNNNPSHGNKAGGPHDDSGKISWRGGEKRLGSARGGGGICGDGERPWLRVHGHARLRSGGGDRADRRWLQPDHFHHRARVDRGLQAGALHQARDQYADVSAYVRGYGRELRHHRHRRRQRQAGWRGDFCENPGCGFR